jgi:hypothetical protein
VDGYSNFDCCGSVQAAVRVIASIKSVARPSNAIEVTVIGHQFWWEYRYPSLKVVTADELYIPASDPAHPTPTFLTLLSADTGEGEKSWKRRPIAVLVILLLAVALGTFPELGAHAPWSPVMDSWSSLPIPFRIPPWPHCSGAARCARVSGEAVP